MFCQYFHYGLQFVRYANQYVSAIRSMHAMRTAYTESTIQAMFNIILAFLAQELLLSPVYFFLTKTVAADTIVASAYQCILQSTTTTKKKKLDEKKRQIKSSDAIC